MKKRYSLFGLACLLILSCKTPLTLNEQPTDDGKIEFVFLQVNDVYEISALEGGAVGGMARLATLKQQLLAKNKHTYTVHAGDFLNPSLLGTLRYEGSKLKGRQMVEAMNAVGFDLVAFGNHEFDLDENDLQKRLNESEFPYIATNIQQRCGDRLYPFYREVNGEKHFYPKTHIWELEDADGTTIKVGFFSATIDSNPKDYVLYEDYIQEATKAKNQLLSTTDVVIGLTHLALNEDMVLAKKFQDVPLIMGGHEHENMRHEIGNCIITKADANAKTAYVHTLVHDKKTGKTTLSSELVALDEQLTFEPKTQAIVDKWSKVLEEKISEIVPNPNEVIYEANPALDGRDSKIRTSQTNLGELATSAMLKAQKTGAEAAFLNSGSFRIDDQISGEITSIDIFRALPFGGGILEVEITGKLLKTVLDYSEASNGKGAYLQRKGLTVSNNETWLINDKAIVDNQNYTIAINDFLLKGYDIPALTADAEGIIKVNKPVDTDKTDVRNDLRLAIVAYLREQ